MVKLNFLLLNAIFLVVSILGMKFDASLEKIGSYPCLFCGEESQFFYELGSSIYCEVCTIRYVASNIEHFDPKATKFYVSDIIFDKLKQDRPMEEDLRVPITNLVREQITSKLSADFHDDWNTELKTITLFKKVNKIIKQKKLFFEEKKCEDCLKLIYNTRKLDCCEAKICFNCYSSGKEKNNTECKFCKTPSCAARMTTQDLKKCRPQRVLDAINEFVKELRNFKHIICDFCSIFMFSNMRNLSKEEEKMVRFIDWKNILTENTQAQYMWNPKKFSFVSWEYAGTVIKVISPAAQLILLITYVDENYKTAITKHSALILFAFQLFGFFSLEFFIDLKRSFCANYKLTSNHKNFKLRKIEFNIDEVEKIFTHSLWVPFLSWIHSHVGGEFSLGSLFIIPFGILNFILFYFLDLIIMHYITKSVIEKEECNFF